LRETPHVVAGTEQLVDDLRRDRDRHLLQGHDVRVQPLQRLGDQPTPPLPVRVVRPEHVHGGNAVTAQVILGV
jgi:hypothetical protein